MTTKIHKLKNKKMWSFLYFIFLNKFCSSCDLMVIQDIQEVSQYMEVKFMISLQWMDARVLYYNIKPDENMNSLTLDEQLALWTPTILFWNTKDQLRTANDKITFASIRQDGNGSTIEKEVNEDIEVYQGSENPITIAR